MAADVDMADALSDLPSQPASHPDARATVTDFLDYTDFFPADLARSLTLITKLDNSYLESADKVHELTTVCGKLPTLPASQRPDPRSLRTQISAALDHAIHCRESAYTEAARLYDVAERHCNRLATIKRKLQALPRPPSRDPTPAPVSPRTTRPRQTDSERTPRITLHVDGARSAATAGSAGATARPRHRGRKITVPGDILPPPNPDSPPPSTVTDWDESAPSSPVGAGDAHEDAPSQIKRGGKAGRVKVPKPRRAQKGIMPKAPRVRPPGVMGTNVHSAVAGISTSNALALLTPPPPDAKPGSKWQPWFKLTEYEMALLRKSMKKNAIWTPSDTMIRRQLHTTGRGRENYLKACAEAEAAGVPLLDEDPVDPTKKVLAPGEVSFQPSSKNEADLINRGMKLNEAKKLKKESMAREQAARDAMEIEEASRRIADAGNMFKNLFSQPSTDGDSVTVAVPVVETKSKPVKKRKRESTPEAGTADANEPPNAAKDRATRSPGPKKIKISHAAARQGPASAPAAPEARATQSAGSTAPATSSISIPPPLTKQTPSVSPTGAKAPAFPVTTITSTAAGTRSRRTSVPPKTASPAPASNEAAALVPAPAAAERAAMAAGSRRPGSRAASAKAASVEPLTKREPRELRELRRGSNASLPASPTAASSGGAAAGADGAGPAPGAARTSGRRGKRPAPGLVTADEDGKGKVSVGKRVAAPRRKGSRKAEEKEREREREDRKSVV